MFLVLLFSKANDEANLHILADEHGGTILREIWIIRF
jgi:hypothetical protein